MPMMSYTEEEARKKRAAVNPMTSLTASTIQGPAVTKPKPTVATPPKTVTPPAAVTQATIAPLVPRPVAAAPATPAGPNPGQAVIDMMRGVQVGPSTMSGGFGAGDNDGGGINVNGPGNSNHGGTSTGFGLTRGGHAGANPAGPITGTAGQQGTPAFDLDEFQVQDDSMVADDVVGPGGDAIDDPTGQLGPDEGDVIGQEVEGDSGNRDDVLEEIKRRRREAIAAGDRNDNRDDVLDDIKDQPKYDDIDDLVEQFVRDSLDPANSDTGDEEKYIETRVADRLGADLVGARASMGLAAS